MNPTAQLTTPPANEFSLAGQRTTGRVLFALFLAAFVVVWLKTLFPNQLLEGTGWPEAMLLLTATASTLASLSRELPLQNVLGAAALIGLLGGFANVVAVRTGFSFGPRLLNAMPWAAPLGWVIAILTSRGVARLALRPWRKNRAYGFWVLGLTASLVVVLDLAGESFVGNGPTAIHLLAGLAMTVLILALATPLLINKKPGQPPPLAYHPLVAWTLLHVLFLTGAVVHQHWVAAGCSVLAILAAAIVECADVSALFSGRHVARRKAATRRRTPL